MHRQRCRSAHEQMWRRRSNIGEWVMTQSAILRWSLCESRGATGSGVSALIHFGCEQCLVGEREAAGLAYSRSNADGGGLTVGQRAFGSGTEYICPAAIGWKGYTRPIVSVTRTPIWTSVVAAGVSAGFSVARSCIERCEVNSHPIRDYPTKSSCSGARPGAHV